MAKDPKRTVKKAKRGKQLVLPHTGPLVPKGKVEILVVDGVGGVSLYVGGYRVAGHKPWGGGRIVHRWQADKKDLEAAIKRAAEQDAKG